MQEFKVELGISTDESSDKSEQTYNKELSHRNKSPDVRNSQLS